MESLLTIEPPLPSDTLYVKRKLGRSVVFVDGGSPGNPTIDPQLPSSTTKSDSNDEVHILYIASGDLEVPTQHLKDPTKGLRFKPSQDGPSQILLVPRAKSLHHMGTKRSIGLCNALDAVEAEVKTTLKRGGKKHVVRHGTHKYICVGTQTCRATTGIRDMHYALTHISQQHQAILCKHFSKMDELFVQFVDTDQIRLVKEGIDLVQAKTFSVPTRKAPPSRIYGAFASGINVYLSSHSDCDFTYAATSIHQKKITMHVKKWWHILHFLDLVLPFH